MAKREAPLPETTQSTENGQLEQLAALNGAAMGAFTDACQAYVKGVFLFNEELTGFMNTRLQHDAELGRSLADCNDWNEVVKLQQSWVQEAAAEYQAESGKLAQIASKMASESWAPIQQRANAAVELTHK